MKAKFILAKMLIRQGFASVSRFWATFLDNSYVFLSGKKAHRGPISIIWDITDKCNLGCNFCGWGKINSNVLSSGRRALDTEDKVRIARKIANAGVWLLSFCGGEPLLCEDLELLIKECKSSGMAVNVSTNGLLLEDKAKMLVDAGVDSITISIDGYSAEALDKIRGHAGLFEKIEKGIGKVRDLSGTRPVLIEARYLINKLNAYDLARFVDYWGEKVDFILFKPIYKNPHVFYKIPLEMRLNSEDEESFRGCFLKFLKKYKVFNNEYNRLIPNFLFKPDSLKNKYICFAGIFFAGISSEGNLYPCHELTALPNNPLGNLIADDFMDLWNSRDIANLRRHFKEKQRCDCWVDRFAPSIYLERLLLPFDRLLRIFNHDQAKKI